MTPCSQPARKIVAHSVIKPTDCAIIIVAWNCWPLLFKCLDTLQTQSVTGFRIVIVDNGDAEPPQLAYATSHANVTYIKSPCNLGFAAGNNLGINSVDNAHWIFLLNPDTEVAPTWFETMIDAAQHFPDFSAFGCTLLMASDRERLDGEGDCYSISGFAWRSGMGLLARNKYPQAREVFSACAAGALYKADALKQIGGFDEDFFCYMEDVDLGFRLRLAGYRCLTVPNAEVLHVGSATTGKRSSFYVYYGQRNLVWAYVKNMPGTLFWIFLPLHVALNIAGVLRYALTGHFMVVLHAKFDAIKALPHMWRKRQKIQNSRRVGLIEILRTLDKHPVPGLGRTISSLWK